jgi:hypothetical protein
VWHAGFSFETLAFFTTELAFFTTELAFFTTELTEKEPEGHGAQQQLG